MKWTCSKDIVQEMLSKTQGFTERKTTLSILGHVLLVAGEETLKIRATDLHTSIEVHSPCLVERPGRCAINAKGFLDVVRELPSGDMVFETDDDGSRAHLVLENKKIILNIMDPDEFPSIDLNVPSSGTHIPVEAMKHLIEKTMFSIPHTAETDTKYSLGGALLITRPENKGRTAVEMVTTDTRRLSLSRYVMDGKISMGEGIIVPRKGLQEIKKLFDEKEQGAGVVITPTSLYYVSETTSATVRLFEGTFPEYRNVVDLSTYPNTVRMNAQELLGVLRVCAVMVSDLMNCVRFSFKKDKTIVYANNPEQGEVDTVISSELDGDEVDISFNPRYFIDCLAFIEQDALLHLRGSQGPCLVMDADHDDCKWIIMPMRY
ncbi:MAG TPA: DNA polymerase III subunit beta [Deltaproteobacteria bacterium]|nr:DNA polymerase III subunit beta [Deltaproteobacteria bacterium]HPP79922.1 DNA polymerase III subunit beta [Deltaproteobacteria bacterium]